MINGGSDAIAGLGGDDYIAMYDTLDATDFVLGDEGNDLLSLDGDYSAGVVFDMSTISGIEMLTVGAGYDYKLTTNDNNILGGEQLTVSAGYLGVANHLEFDGSAETDGKFTFYGGAGNDVFTGGAGDDYFDANNGGNDQFRGGDGNDSVSFFGAYTTSDYVDGGAGNDRVYLYGNFAGGLTLGSAQMKTSRRSRWGRATATPSRRSTASWRQVPPWRSTLTTRLPARTSSSTVLPKRTVVSS